MGAAPGERARRVMVVAVVVVEWCARGLAWFPWDWGGFGPVLGRNPANATSRGRAKVKAPPPAGPPAEPAAVRAAGEGV